MKLLGVTLIATSLAVLLLFLAGEYYAADVCLDAGQVYDYGTSQCRADVDHLPYVPYAKNFSWGVVFAVLALPVGIWCFVVGQWRRL